MERWLVPVVELLDKGGFVVPPLLVIGAVLGFALGERSYLLRRGTRRNLRALMVSNETGPAAHSSALLLQAVLRTKRLLAACPHQHLATRLDTTFDDLYRLSQHHRVLIRSLVAIAPLLGLLGTVNGMIETFSSLGTMSMHSQSGGVAGGVSEALLSTQIGLVIAVPALLFGRVLDRREQAFAEELEQLKDFARAHRDEFLPPHTAAGET